MRDYGTVSPHFWTRGTGKKLRGDVEAQILALYLMTSPHSSMTGVYHCPVLYMATETGLTLEGASKGLRRLIEEGFCTFDEASDTVFVHSMAAHQIGEQLDPKDKRVIGIRREVAKMPEGPVRQAFLATYSVAFHLIDLVPNRNLSEAPSKPHRSQEQEQEQEQEQDRRESAAAQRTPRPRREDMTLATYLQQCREAKVKPVPDDHAVRAYCRDAGITEEMLQVAWCVFREDYTAGTNRLKRYRDWPGHFHNAVKGCWAKLWFTEGSEVKWTSNGLTQRNVLEARMNRQGAAHAA